MCSRPTVADFDNSLAPRRAGGPSGFTHQIHAFIKANPGVSRDGVLTAAFQREWVERGYAHRSYAKHLNSKRRKNAERRETLERPASSVSQPETPKSISRTRSDQAVTFVVRRQITNMLANGSIRADESGGLRVVRDLRATTGLAPGQAVATPEQHLRIATELELLRALRPMLDTLEASHSRLTLDVRRKLKAWAEAHDNTRRST